MYTVEYIMKPTCIECGESCDTEKKVVEHIHRKHGHHSCQHHIGYSEVIMILIV